MAIEPISMKLLTRGVYRIKAVSKDGKDSFIQEAWFNPISYHWLNVNDKGQIGGQIGFDYMIGKNGEDYLIVSAEFLREK